MVFIKELPPEEIVSRGLAEASQEDWQSARTAMATEQKWLAGVPRFNTNQDVQEAYERAELVWVGPNETCRPVKTLLEPKNFDTHQPYLTLGAADMLLRTGMLAQAKLREFGVRDIIRFPITSMVRSAERQAELAAQPGKLALPPEESGHSTGWDFDIDSSGYYLLEEGRWKSVSRRNREHQSAIGTARERLLGEVAMPTEIAAPGRYDSRVRLALHFAVAELYSTGALCPVVEYANSGNELLHIGVNPHY